MSPIFRAAPAALSLLALQGPVYSQTAQDIGWPRQVERDGAVLVYYQPQVEEWTNYQQLKAEMAFSLTPPRGREVLGVASFAAGTLVDMDARTVYVRNIQIPSVRFPALPADSAKTMRNLFLRMVPSGGDPISLDRLTADLQQQQIVERGVAVNNDPPPIFYSSSPAIL